MKPLLAVLLLCLSGLTHHARAQETPTSATATATATGEADIRVVVEAFRTAIIDRDKARFLRLFLDGNTIWQSVKSDAMLQLVQRKKPEASKAPVSPASTPLSFIDSIVAAKSASEEKFADIRIDSDGDVAAVSFDYSFHSDGRMTNYGQESWQLVRTEAGWRIVSVVWSVNLPPPPQG